MLFALFCSWLFILALINKFILWPLCLEYHRQCCRSPNVIPILFENINMYQQNTSTEMIIRISNIQKLPSFLIIGLQWVSHVIDKMVSCLK